jgi:ribosomal protein S18 acetylase RimI-like enzyme
MQVVVEPARPEHLAEISALAAVIWRAHYPGIITPEQIDYMLARMYNVGVMRLELESGIDWFRVLVDDTLCGFASVGPSENPIEFKLHKLYVHPDWQRHGLGSALLEEIESTACAQGATMLVLNVNKRNERAIAAYLKRGFAIRESIVADIGSDFVMDDYVMVKSLVGTSTISQSTNRQ